MEHMGAISELNWNFPDESEVTMAQLLGDQEASFGIDPLFWSDQSAATYSMFDNLSSCWPGFQSYDMGNSNIGSTNSMDYFVSEEQMSGSYQVEDLMCSKDGENEPKEPVAVHDQNSEAKRKFLEPENGAPSESDPKKKARASAQVQKSSKNARSKKAQKNAGSTAEEALSIASCSSEDESNTSQELNDGSGSSVKGKTRAGRGSATDPQSLYARKRRERINERLRILQKLVPNGTKVDISTMLEEAVQYVKFLQLQIKLLSSDDMWMYAPLAYNGMDIGLDLKIHLPQ